MCEEGFLSHWDITGQKPYQRYSDFAYGQHVSEVAFGFDLYDGTEDEVRMLVGIGSSGNAGGGVESSTPSSLHSTTSLSIVTLGSASDADIV